MASVVAVALANTLLIVVPALALLAGLLIVGAASRSDRDEVIGHLSRETLRADRTEPRPVAAVASGREIEHRAALERLSPGTAHRQSTVEGMSGSVRRDVGGRH